MRPKGSARAPSHQPCAGAPPELQGATDPGNLEVQGESEKRRDPDPAAGQPEAGGSREPHRLGPGSARSIPGPAGRGALGQRRSTLPHAPRSNSAQVSAPAELLPAGRQAARCCRPGPRTHPPAPLRPWILVWPGPGREVAVSSKPRVTLLAAVRAAAGRRLRSGAGRAGGGAGAERPER